MNNSQMPNKVMKIYGHALLFSHSGKDIIDGIHQNYYFIDGKTIKNLQERIELAIRDREFIEDIELYISGRKDK